MVITCLKDGWRVQVTRKDTGCVYEFQRQFTLSGAAENLDLNIPFPIALNRIEYTSNDATAKSFTEDIYTGSLGGFDRIVALVNDTNIPVAYAGSEDNIYTQSPVVVRTAVSASTAGKLLTKKVIVTRL